MTTEFYKDREIFITGGSGVVGKAAIEKLLRSCDVKKIYVLMRTKNNVSPANRLEDMKNSRIFKVLKECKPNELNKLVAIPGDTALDGLGISLEHREMIRNVSIFFHSAATTRFDEPLRVAIRLNLKSTLEALKIGQTLQNLQIFIHVSTFFSNPYLEHVQDKVYPAVFDWRTAITMLDSDYDNSEPIIDAITNKIKTDFPNTYVFTKHLAEQLVNDYCQKVPVAIFRPSVVVGALEEPEPGFSESVTGLMALILIWGTGLLKVLSCNKAMQLDFTPLDVGTKTMLIFTAKMARLQREKLQELAPVGMFSSYGLLHYNIEEVGNMLTKIVHDIPYEKSFWIPNIRLTECPFIYMVYIFFLQLLPAIFIDGILRICGRKPFMMKIQRKIFYTQKVGQHFIKNEYKSDGATDFQEILKTEKGTKFNIGIMEHSFDSSDRIHETLTIVTKGCRKFLMNEDESTLPRCRQILKWKIYVYNIIRLCVLMLFAEQSIQRL